MIEMTATVNQADIADLNRSIDLMIRNTRRLGKDAVHRAAYQFLRSAKAQTPAAKKKTRTLHNKNDAGAVETWKMKNGEKVLTKSSKPSKYYVVQRQGKKPIIILMPNPDFVKGRDRKREAREVFNELKKKYKYKPNMRAAKNSWNRAFSELGKAVAYTMEIRNKQVLAASRAKKLGGNFTPSIRITNDLSYLTKIAPRLEGNAMRAAGKSLLKMVERGIEKQVRKF